MVQTKKGPLVEVFYYLLFSSDASLPASTIAAAATDAAKIFVICSILLFHFDKCELKFFPHQVHTQVKLEDTFSLGTACVCRKWAADGLAH